MAISTSRARVAGAFSSDEDGIAFALIGRADVTSVRLDCSFFQTQEQEQQEHALHMSQLQLKRAEKEGVGKAKVKDSRGLAAHAATAKRKKGKKGGKGDEEKEDEETGKENDFKKQVSTHSFARLVMQRCTLIA